MRVRKSAASKLLIATILSMLLLGTSGTRAHAFTNGQNASLVIGQSDFTSTHSATSQSGLNFPDRVRFDPSGNMWVADQNNNRLLEFKPPFFTGMQASLVIGQPNFTSNAPATSQSGLDATNTLTILHFGFDSLGNLWVADIDNNRVLEFKPPLSNGMAASLVIGQKSFTTAIAGGSNNGLRAPDGLAFDHSDNLWVIDQSNHRILEFRPPFSSGMSASLVIGQPDLQTTSDQRSLTRSGLSGKDGSDLTFDSSGNLWVGDGGNNRVLEFSPPFTNGMNASLVIGQKSYTTSKASTTQNGLRIQPDGYEGVAFDPTGNLWVGDFSNNRILEFVPPFSTGMSASLVIGQQDFTTGTSATTQNGLSGPTGLVFDSSGSLWVPDVYNNRVLEFTLTPIPEFPTASLAIIALASLAVVAVITRRFSVRRLDL